MTTRVRSQSARSASPLTRAARLLVKVAATVHARGHLSEAEQQDIRLSIRPWQAGRLLSAAGNASAAREFVESQATVLLAKARELAARFPDGEAVYADAIRFAAGEREAASGLPPTSEPAAAARAKRRAPRSKDAGQRTAKTSRKRERKWDGQGTSPARVRRSPPPLDGLSENAIRLVGQKREFCLHVERGLSLNAALERAELPYSISAAKKVLRRYRQHGLAGLVDRRAVNGRAPEVPEEIRAMTTRWFIARKGAAPKQVWELVAAECKRVGLTPPGYKWVVKFIREMDPHLKKAAREGLDAWERDMAPRGTANTTLYANEVWQIDHCRADVWVRVRDRSGDWEPEEVWITAVMDVHSRAIMSVIVSLREPTAWTTALALRKAILPKARGSIVLPHGKPTVLVPDNGKDFRAHAVASSVRALGILPKFARPRNPNDKSELERWFGTMQRGLLSTFVGYKGAGMKSREAAAKRVDQLETFDILREHLDRWIETVYHERVHEGISSGTDDWTPIARWRASVRLVEVPKRELDVLLLKSDKRRVVTQRGTIRLKHPRLGKLTYYQPRLLDHVGEQVRLRYNPDDMASILVYPVSDDEPICEAWDRDHPDCPYTNRDIVQERRHRRATLVERMDQHAAAAETEAARSPRVWRAAQQEAEQLALLEAEREREAEAPSREEEALLAEIDAALSADTVAHREAHAGGRGATDNSSALAFNDSGDDPTISIAGGGRGRAKRTGQSQGSGAGDTPTSDALRKGVQNAVASHGDTIRTMHRDKPPTDGAESELADAMALLELMERRDRSVA